MRSATERQEYSGERSKYVISINYEDFYHLLIGPSPGSSIDSGLDYRKLEKDQHIQSILEEISLIIAINLSRPQRMPHYQNTSP
jgi:hypothetical protein